jgi:hypothetical protein
MTDTTTLPPALVAQLEAANGRRRERTLGADSLAAVLRLLADAPDDRPWVYNTGGSVAGSYGYNTRSTVIMAARVDGHTYCGVGVASATTPTPGCVWSELQPFGRGKRFPDKLRQWTKRPDVHRID